MSAPDPISEASISIDTGEGGLPRVVLAHPRGGRAEVYLHGAHVARWTTPDGAEALYLSPRARFGPGSSIRGGVPVIFPQFADQGPLPKHGFARTAEWELAESSASDGEGARAVLRLADSDETRAVWSHAFRLTLTATLADSLSITLSVENTGDAPIDFTCALHGYYRVGDVHRAAVDGLDGVRYRDKVAGGEAQQAGEIDFRGEVDRVYCAAPAELRLHDGAGARTVVIRKDGFADAVVWNPWTETGGKMEDLGGDEYLRFVCVEPANACAPVRLEPGERWEGTQTVTVETD